MPRNGKSKLILRIFGDPQNYVPRWKIALNKTLRKFVIFSQIRNYKRESIANIKSTFFVLGPTRSIYRQIAHRLFTSSLLNYREDGKRE